MQVSQAGSSAPFALLPDLPEAPEYDHEVHHHPRVASGSTQLGPMAPTAADPVLQSVIPSVNMPAAVVNFLAQGNTNSKSTITGDPPDTVGAVGPNHFVQTVNGGIEIWNKAGTVMAASKSTSALWAGYTCTNTGCSCSTRNDGDAVVVYDSLADRWFITQFSLPNQKSNAGPSFQCVAVSKTNDPTGAYWLYDFKYAAAINDYGKFGAWQDAYYAALNLFGSTAYIGDDFCAYDRASMLNGNPASQQCFLQTYPTEPKCPSTQTFAVFGALPVTLDGHVKPPNGEPGYFLQFDYTACAGPYNQLDLWKMHVDWTTPANSTVTGPTVLNVANFNPTCYVANGSPPNCVPQPGSTTTLDGLDDRVMFRFNYRNFGTYESLLVNHSVQGGAGSGIRWYEIRSPNGTPTVYQQGTYAPADTKWRWMGSIAQDQAADMALGFAAISPNTPTLYGSVGWTGRLATDAVGTMGQGESIIDTGRADEFDAYFPNGRGRWGDYSAMTVDPTDDCTFWYTQELYNTGGISTWDTYIASMKFPNCGANDFTGSVTPSPQSVPQGGSVNYTVATTLAKGTAEAIVLNVQDLPSGVTGTFNPTSVTAGGSSTLTLTATPTAPLAGNTTFTVIGTAPSAVHAFTAQVSVVASGNLPPIVAITTPASGATVSGTIPITVTGTAGSGSTLSSLSISIDGAQVQTGAISPQTYNWNTTTTTNGVHTITAKATDADGLASTTSVSVTVKNAPTVTVTAPANGATVSGTVAVSATATPPGGTTLSTLAISIDGAQVVSGATSPQNYSWNTTGLANGSTHTIVATATDADGSNATSSTVTVTVKNNPTVSVTAPANGATVSGTVAVNATAAAPAGTTLSSLAISIDGTRVVSGATSPQTYSWNTTGLANGSTHTIVATATDADGSNATSSTVTVTVKNNPTVAVTAPSNGATVSGTVAVNATATAPNGTTLSTLAISIDGAQVVSGATSPQAYNWNTTTLANGSTHTIVATATDADGSNATSSTVTVTVKNAPSTAVTAPANGATVSGTTAVSATGTPANGTTLTSLAISIDGSQVVTGASSPQSYNWNTTTLANGSTHAIVSTATDADGLSATSSSVTVTVKNKPTVAITTPSNGANVSGTTAITATGSAPSGTSLSSLSLSIDGTQVATGATSPETYNWDTTTLANGTTHTVVATATDADGLVNTFTITVTIRNNPVAAVTAPANGSNVSGTVAVGATGSAPLGTTLSSLSISIDGTQFATGASSPQAYNWDTTTLANGSTHTIVATATDADGTTATSSPVTVTIRNKPSVSVTAPANGANVSGTTPLSAIAAPPNGTTLSTLSISVDGNQVQTGASSPQSFNWDTTTLANGSTHTIVATATDADGTTATSATVTVTIRNNPTAAISAPANGATVAGVTTVSATGAAPLGTTLSALAISIDGTSVQTGASSPTSYSWDTTTVANGSTHALVATATDADGTTSSSTTVNVTVDNPPGVVIGAPASGATVNGTVAVNVAAVVPNGATLAALSISIDGTQVATGAVSPGTYAWDTTVSGNGAHVITAVATDADGLSATASETVNVLNAPAVSISSPANNAVVSGSVTIGANASAPLGTTLSTLSLSIDGNPVQSGGSSPQAYTWDTTTLANGSSHAIVATATDADGSTASTTVTVTVQNNPLVAIAAPADGSTVGGSVAITANATPPVGTTLSTLAISVDGTQVTSGASSPQTFNWDSTAFANGSSHSISATATDADGTTASTTITVTVMNNPTVAISAPADGATVSGTTPVTATANVPAGTTIATLVISIDGAQVQTGTATPETFSWDTTTASNGSHTISAQVTDADGTSATSSSVTVIVSNGPNNDGGSGSDGGSGNGNDGGNVNDGGSGNGNDAGNVSDGGSGNGTDGGEVNRDGGSSNGSDAGSVENLNGADGGDVNVHAKGCGCADGGSAHAPALAGLLGILGAALSRRRRRPVRVTRR